MWRRDTWYSHAHQAHAAAESPGQEAGAGLSVCSLMVLTDVAGEVHGSITQISGNHQLRGHWGRSLVHWSNIWRRRNFSFNKQDFNCEQQFSNICFFSWLLSFGNFVIFGKFGLQSQTWCVIVLWMNNLWFLDTESLLLTLTPGWGRVGSNWVQSFLVETVRICHVVLMVGDGHSERNTIAGHCHGSHLWSVSESSSKIFSRNSASTLQHYNQQHAEVISSMFMWIWSIKFLENDITVTNVTLGSYSLILNTSNWNYFSFIRLNCLNLQFNTFFYLVLCDRLICAPSALYHSQYHDHTELVILSAVVAQHINNNNNNISKHSAAPSSQHILNHNIMNIASQCWHITYHCIPHWWLLQMLL